jgi:hypothetical protein
MTVSKEQARRMKEIMQELIENGSFTVPELVHRVRREIPQAEPEDLKRAIEARLFEIDEDEYERAVEVQWCKRSLRIIERASEQTGIRDPMTFEAALLMAEKNDPEAIALLREIQEHAKGIS